MENNRDAPTWQVIGAGVVALAIAMGIGRFAFTPLLPLMLRDGALEGGSGATWAAANYAGYLLGALTAPLIASRPDKGMRPALVGIAATTVAIPLAVSLGWAGLGPLLRGASGVFSAWVLVGTSAWCLTELARRGRAEAGAWVYTGVGIGIALTGILTWLGGGEPSGYLWLGLGVIASLGFAPVAYVMRRGRREPRDASRVTTGKVWRREPLLILAYGAFGFGYIVPATFLPVMARRQVDDPLIFGLTWPLFGLAAALSVAAAARWLSGRPRRRVWALAQTAMAIGTALPFLTQSIWSLAASAVFVGGSFMISTMAGLQLARELDPENPAPLQAAMTVAFAVGQILGPLLVQALGTGLAGVDPLSVSHACATIVLAVTAAWLWAGSRAPAISKEETR
ncbi:MAG: transporter [Hyphomicrobiales bacterium]|nr:transporter [Hyphomicrobiales bacterium]